MRNAFDILALWLTISFGLWLFGLALAGELTLPPLNLFTAAVLYAPWLLLMATGIKAWRLRDKKITD